MRRGGQFEKQIWRLQCYGLGWDHGKTDLVIVNGNLGAAEYISHVLRPIAVPFIIQHAPATLMHDYAGPHTVQLTQ